ncbi:hypothetical protein IF2G_03902 [Cordyceps javanica]|nr:hypothetical protein IF2G_03902 [Cordyceps javanica]
MHLSEMICVAPPNQSCSGCCLVLASRAALWEACVRTIVTSRLAPPELGRGQIKRRITNVRHSALSYLVSKLQVVESALVFRVHHHMLESAHQLPIICEAATVCFWPVALQIFHSSLSFANWAQWQ